MSQQHIFDPNRSVVLVAAAGTGKTWRLVRRYLKLIGTTNSETGEPWAGVDQVVAVTFTRAAASEMRQKVIEALRTPPGKVDDDDVVLQEILQGDPARIQRLIIDLAAAPIDTIHGLCARLLREFPELSAVPPDARPVEPGEAAVLAARFVGQFLDSVMDDADHSLHADLAALLEERPLGEVRTEIGAMVDAAEPIPAEWLVGDAVASGRRNYLNGQVAAIHGQILPALEAARAAIDTRYSVQSVAGKLDEQLSVQGALLEKARDELLDLTQGEATDLLAALAKLSLGKLDKKVTANLPVRDALSAVKEAVERARRVRGQVVTPHLPPAMDGDPGRTFDEGERVHGDRLRRWASVGNTAREAFEAHLLRRGLLRFDDLERRAVELLKKEEARAYLRDRFTHLLVDEFQDTNRRQVEILEGLKGASGHLTTFYVGDPKQSIYRFRGAEVEVFEKEVRQTGELVELHETRRTAPRLNGFFNAFFPLVLGDLAGLGPEPLQQVSDGAPVAWPDGGVAPVRPKDALDGLPVDLLLRTPAPERDEDDEEGEKDGAEDHKEELDREWDRVALHVRSLIGRALDLEKGPAEVRPRDVAILLPKWRHAEDFRAALERRGVAAQVAGGRGLLELPEVCDLVNLVRFWARWEDTLAAVGVLRGPTLAVSDLGLLALLRWPGVERWDWKGKAWMAWDELVDGQRSGPRTSHTVALSARLRPEVAFAAMERAGVVPDGARDELLARLESDARSLEAGRPILRDLQLRAGAEPTAELLAEAITRFRLEAHWLASPRGPRAVANAWKFVEAVRTLEAEGPDLGAICAWIDGHADLNPVGLIEGDADAVTITTLHGAKGLEWRVVVLAGLGQIRGGGAGASWRADAAPTLENRQARIPLPRVKAPAGGFEAFPDPIHEVCKAMVEPLEAAETKRLLYVGMTRAMDRLVLSGDVGAAGRIGKRHRDRLPGPFLGGATQASLYGQPMPLYLCRHERDYLVAGLELRPEEDGSPVLAPAPEGPWAGSLHVIRDEDLLEAAGPGRDEGEPPNFDEDPEAVAWRPATDITPWTPSGNSVPDAWKRTGITWSEVAPVPDPVPLPTDEADHEATDTGTLFHEVMEAWGFVSDPPDGDQLQTQAERFFPDDGSDHRVWMERCVNLIAHSPLADELRDAAARGELIHEAPIDVLVDGEYRVQGRIDALFRDADGRWCVLDYKLTRRVTTAEEIRRVQSHYGKQLLLYRRALQPWCVARGEELGRFGLWLAPAGKVTWIEDWGSPADG